MKFSILTPSYNYGRFISDCLDSVQGQNVDVEHVIADGASTDETVTILDSRDQMLTWFSEPDGGQSDALNKAFARSTGEIIGWLNADEYYLPGALEQAASIFVNDPNVMVVYGDSIEVDEHGGFIRLQKRYPGVVTPLLRYGCVISSCATFIRRSALDDAPWDPRLRTVMDWDLWVRLALRHPGGFAYSDGAKGAFRVHDAQVTSQPLPANSDQHKRVRARYERPNGPISRPLDRVLGRSVHVAKRVSYRAYSIEAKTRSGLAATGTRWFDPTRPSDLVTVDGLIGGAK